MNGTGLGIAAILFVVLFAVVMGAQEMDNRKSAELAEMTRQRDEVIALAQQAAIQRNEALIRFDEAVARAASAEARLNQALAERDQVLAALAHREGEILALQEQVKNLSAQNASLQASAQNLIPVTGVTDPAGWEPVQPVGGETACIPLTDAGPTQPYTAGILFIIGTALLGGGGYALYRTDPAHKVSVRMTREQLKAYIRYQREGTNGPLKIR